MTQCNFQMTHVIDAILTKKMDYYNPIHYEVIGCPCKFLEIKEGERGWIGYESKFDHGAMHRMHVSNIHHIIYEDGEETGENGNVLIETEYSYYHFVPINQYDQAASYSVRYGESAREYILGNKQRGAVNGVDAL